MSGDRTSPIMLRAGREDLDEQIFQPLNEAMREPETTNNRYILHLQKLDMVRSRYWKRGEEQTVNIAANRVMRKGSQTTFKPNDLVEIWCPKKRICLDGLRLLTERGRNGAIEGGRRLRKLPIAWI